MQVGGLNRARARAALVSAATALLALLATGPAAHGAPSVLTVRSAPILIGPYDTDRASGTVPTPQVEGFVTAMSVRVVDAAGRTVPQTHVMLHHLIVQNDAVREPADRGPCPRHTRGQRFFGTSEERRALSLPPGYGYPVRAGDPWTAAWMLMNHRARARLVRLEFRVTVDPRRDLVPVTPYWVSVAGCTREPIFTVRGGLAPGATHRQSVAWRVPSDGRIVALGGHLHGGGIGLALAQPRCGGRELFASRPTYGPPTDPLYRARPLLHEPDPKNMSWFRSATGFAVARGERLRLTATYDAERPHMRVMGIMHVYLAADPVAPAGCASVPADARVLGSSEPGRTAPPRVELGLARIGADGVARPMRAPPEPRTVVSRSTRVEVSDLGFSPMNLSIPLGASVRWRFPEALAHDVTLASGPRGFASPTLARGGSFRRRFDVPGVYRVLCSIHPAVMAQVVTVRSTP